MDKILEAFEFGKIQECVNIKLKLDEHDISWEEFLEWVEKRAKEPMPVRDPREVPYPPNAVLKRLCPGCEKHYLDLSEVNNDNPGMMVGGTSKCQWFCLWCAWEEYSDKDVKEEAEPYITYK